jgi:hypothetical protein
MPGGQRLTFLAMRAFRELLLGGIADMVETLLRLRRLPLRSSTHSGYLRFEMDR